jgi:hypothetical protein
MNASFADPSGAPVSGLDAVLGVPARPATE